MKVTKCQKCSIRDVISLHTHTHTHFCHDSIANVAHNANPLLFAWVAVHPICALIPMRSIGGSVEIHKGLRMCELSKKNFFSHKQTNKQTYTYTHTHTHIHSHREYLNMTSCLAAAPDREVMWQRRKGEGERERGRQRGVGEERERERASRERDVKWEVRENARKLGVFLQCHINMIGFATAADEKPDLGNWQRAGMRVFHSLSLSLSLSFFLSLSLSLSRAVGSEREGKAHDVAVIQWDPSRPSNEQVSLTLSLFTFFSLILDSVTLCDSVKLQRKGKEGGRESNSSENLFSPFPSSSLSPLTLTLFLSFQFLDGRVPLIIRGLPLSSSHFSWYSLSLFFFSLSHSTRTPKAVASEFDSFGSVKVTRNMEKEGREKRGK